MHHYVFNPTALYRIKNRDYVECEMELKYFLDAERDKMISRFRKNNTTTESKKSSKGYIYLKKRMFLSENHNIAII